MHDVPRGEKLKLCLCVAQDSDVKAAQQGGNLRFKGVPRQGTLLNKSVIDTLHYCCLYHYDMGEVSACVRLHH